MAPNETPVMFLHGIELEETLHMPVQSDHEPVRQAIPFAQEDGAGGAVFFREFLDPFLDDAGIVGRSLHAESGAL